MTPASQINIDRVAAAEAEEIARPCPNWRPPSWRGLSGRRSELAGAALRARKLDWARVRVRPLSLAAASASLVRQSAADFAICTRGPRADLVSKAGAGFLPKATPSLLAAQKPAPRAPPPPAPLWPGSSGDRQPTGGGRRAAGGGRRKTNVEQPPAESQRRTAAISGRARQAPSSHWDSIRQALRRLVTLCDISWTLVHGKPMRSHWQARSGPKRERARLAANEQISNSPPCVSLPAAAAALLCTVVSGPLV